MTTAAALIIGDEIPAVKIGSYPKLAATDYRIWVSVEAEDGAAGDRAVARLLAVLPAGEVVRVESGSAPAPPE